MIKIQIPFEDGEVSFHDADIGGTLDRLASYPDGELLREEIASRIAVLYRGAGGRVAHADELVGKFQEMRGEQMIITTNGRTYSGSVVVSLPYSRKVLMDTGGSVEELSLHSFSEEPQNMN